MGGMLAWVVWVACLHGWHANMDGVGDMGGVLVWVAWVACLRGWRACLGNVLACVAGGAALT